MNDSREKAIAVLFSIILGWVLYEAIDGVWGYCCGMAFVSLVLLLIALGVPLPIKEGVHTPLLASFLLIVASILGLATLDVADFWIPLAVMGACGAEEIYFWVKDKCYRGKSEEEIFQDEFRVPPACDLVVILFLMYDLLVLNTYQPLIEIAFIAFLAADFVRQVVARKYNFWL